MKITAAMAKALQERMEAEHGWYLGLTETKRALEQVDGDAEKAIELIRKSGKSGRRAAG